MRSQRVSRPIVFDNPARGGKVNENNGGVSCLFALAIGKHHISQVIHFERQKLIVIIRFLHAAPEPQQTKEVRLQCYHII